MEDFYPMPQFVQLEVSDVVKVARWYKEALGFRSVFDGPNGLDGKPVIVHLRRDRYFIDALATQVWVVGGGTMRTYLGNYTDYLEWLSRAREREAEQGRQQAKIQPGGASKNGSAAKPAPQPGPLSANPAANGNLKTISKEERQRLRKISQLEESIAQKEARLVKIEEELNQAGEKQDRDALSRLSLEYAQVQTEIEQLYTDWGVLAR